jgi:hypothetical protein
MSTKYGRRQNLGVNKILASAKSWRRQEAGADKMVAQKNVGADVEEFPYFLPQQSPQLLTSPRPR